MAADPLDMANNCAAAVEALARFQEEDQLGAYVTRAGAHGKQTAEVAGNMAGNMALVSIARDLRRIADHLERGRGDGQA